MQASEKRRTTIYIDPEVLEFLSLRRIKGAGSVSQQLENLARQLMPKERDPNELRALEERHRRGYEAHPVRDDEFAPLIASQIVFDEGPVAARPSSRAARRSK
jgi:hypothetical protein